MPILAKAAEKSSAVPLALTNKGHQRPAL